LCEWCMQHGDGKKWYLNIKNYSRDLLKDKTAVEEFNTFFQNLETFAGMSPSAIIGLSGLTSDEEFTQAVGGLKQIYTTMNPHKGQVVPIEDVREIIDLSGPIAKLACVCRRAFKGGFEEKTCIGLGPVFLEVAKDWPDFTRGGIDYISKEETMELMERFDKKGYVHSFWWGMESPAVMGFCNCEYPSCGALMGRRAFGDMYNFFYRKAEYVAKQKFDDCIGCGKCVQRCQFSAITHSPYLQKAIIDMKKCAGCGLCRNACEQDAIELVPRSDVPAVRRLW
jgi:ferredoxin